MNRSWPIPNFTPILIFKVTAARWAKRSCQPLIIRQIPAREFSKGRRTVLFFSIPLAKTFGNGRAEKGVPLVDFPNRAAHVVSGGLLDKIAHRAGVDRLDDIRFIVVRRKYEYFGGREGFENLAGGL